MVDEIDRMIGGIAAVLIGFTILGVFVAPFRKIMIIVGIALAVLSVGVGALAVSMSKAEKKAGDKNEILERGVPFFKGLGAQFARSTGGAFNRVHIKEDSPDGTIPYIFRRLRVEIHILMSYLTRLHISLYKRNYIESSKRIVEEIQTILQTTWGPNRIKGDAYEFKDGRGSAFDEETTMWSFPEGKVFRAHNDGRIHIHGTYGAFGYKNNKYLICMFWDLVKLCLENPSSLLSKDELGMIATIWSGMEVDGIKLGEIVGMLNEDKGNLVNGEFEDRVEKDDGKMNKDFKSYHNLLEHYGRAQVRDALKMIVTSQKMKYFGWYKHSYIFARPWARPWMVPATIRDGKAVEDKSGRRKRFRLYTPIGPKDGGAKDKIELVEIDERGRVLEDINEIDARLKRFRVGFVEMEIRRLEEGLRAENDPQKKQQIAEEIRKMRVEGVEILREVAKGKKNVLDSINRSIEGKERLKDHNEYDSGRGLWFRQIQFNERTDASRVHYVLQKASDEWSYFVRDLRFGEFHKNVRTWPEYEECHRPGEGGYDWNYTEKLRSVLSEHAPATSANPAFDRQALKDPKFHYRGLSSLRVERASEDLMREVINDMPTLSTLGLTEYIKDLLNEIESNMKLKEEHSGTYVWETGKEEKPFTTKFEPKEERKKEGGK